MSRVVQWVDSDLRDGDGDGYADRVAKYIPGEVVATYLFLLTILSEADRTAGWLEGMYIGVFVLCLVVTPFYMWKRASKEDPRIYQAVMSTIAFAVWAYSLGGVFDIVWKVYAAIPAAVGLAAFTLISGAIVPKKPSSD